MPRIVIPFDLKQDASDSHEDLEQCGLFRMLPPAMQDACHENTHILEYLHILPIEEIGVPQFYSELTRKLGDLKQRNLLYPVADDIMVHVWSDRNSERDLYIPIEPSLFVPLNGKLSQVEHRLLDKADEFGLTEEREEREAALISAIESVCEVDGGESSQSWLSKIIKTQSNKKVRVTAEEYDAIKYLVLRDKVGVGILEPIVRDKHIEDISCSGLGNVFLEHKIFNSMQSAVYFETHDDLDSFVVRLSDQIKKPVTLRKPIVDAVMPDGSRINIVYGRRCLSGAATSPYGNSPIHPSASLNLLNLEAWTTGWRPIYQWYWRQG